MVFNLIVIFVINENLDYFWNIVSINCDCYRKIDSFNIINLLIDL